LAHSHDENAVPSGVELTDQSGLMAGKIVGTTRRSALATVSVNAISTTTSAVVKANQTGQFSLFLIYVLVGKC
jgi:hypothetical protein